MTSHIKKHITDILHELYEEYMMKGIIEAKLDKLRFFHNSKDVRLSSSYMRKFLTSGLLVNKTKSKRHPQYDWKGGENPNFEELLDLVFNASSKEKLNEADDGRGTSIEGLYYKQYYKQQYDKQKEDELDESMKMFNKLNEHPKNPLSIEDINQSKLNIKAKKDIPDQSEVVYKEPKKIILSREQRNQITLTLVNYGVDLEVSLNATDDIIKIIEEI